MYMDAVDTEHITIFVNRFQALTRSEIIWEFGVARLY